MTGDYEARIFDDTANWSRDTVRLAVRQRQERGSAFLMPDGTWLSVEEGMSALDSGVLLPRAAIEAIATAIQEWQGHTNHADTEARVLREWLAVERARVDDALEDRAVR